MCTQNPYIPLSYPGNGKCPICGMSVDDKIAHCWYCHQKFYERKSLPEINENVIYVTIISFIGWVGSGPIYHIALNVATKEYSAVKIQPGNGEESSVCFSNQLINLLCKKYNQLFQNEKIQNNRLVVCDCSEYYVNITMSDKSFRISVYSFLLKKWPILNKIIDELENKN